MSDDARPVRTLYAGQQTAIAYTPTRSPEAAPFWAACREQRLVLPRCTACGRFHFYPRPFCPFCDARSIAWVAASGRGTIHAFAIVRQPIEAAFAARIPYTIAIVELEEGVRMLTRVEGEVTAMACDRPVRVAFDRIADDVVVPIFTLAD